MGVHVSFSQQLGTSERGYRLLSQFVSSNNLQLVQVEVDGVVRYDSRLDVPFDLERWHEAYERLAAKRDPDFQRACDENPALAAAGICLPWPDKPIGRVPELPHGWQPARHPAVSSGYRNQLTKEERAQARRESWSHDVARLRAAAALQVQMEQAEEEMDRQMKRFPHDPDRDDWPETPPSIDPERWKASRRYHLAYEAWRAAYDRAYDGAYEPLYAEALAEATRRGE
jgi:hypothetical protein